VGRTYRLPSESEREYFARAGTTTPFWFGKTISAQNANYDASKTYWLTRVRPHQKASAAEIHASLARNGDVDVLFLKAG
jgi:formylglycine-generating enzyme required for sulfatase activity